MERYKEVDSLKGTVDLMLSDSPKDRLVAEYLQAKIRYQRLCDYLTEVNRKFTCKPPKRSLLVEHEVLECQKISMKMYIQKLENRLELLNIYVGTDD